MCLKETPMAKGHNARKNVKKPKKPKGPKGSKGKK
jgi:hypothetical protein